MLIGPQQKFQSRLLNLFTFLPSGAGAGNNILNKRSLLLQDNLSNRPVLQTVQVFLKSSQSEVSIALSTKQQIPGDFGSHSKICSKILD